MKTVFSHKADNPFLFMLDKPAPLFNINILNEFVKRSFYYNVRFTFSTNSSDSFFFDNCGLHVYTKPNTNFKDCSLDSIKDIKNQNNAKIFSPLHEPFFLKKLTQDNFYELLERLEKNE